MNFPLPSSSLYELELSAIMLLCLFPWAELLMIEFNHSFSWCTNLCSWQVNLLSSIQILLPFPKHLFDFQVQSLCVELQSISLKFLLKPKWVFRHQDLLLSYSSWLSHSEFWFSLRTFWVLKTMCHLLVLTASASLLIACFYGWVTCFHQPITWFLEETQFLPRSFQVLLINHL